MQVSKNLARLGGIVAALSLVFLPLASCGEAQLTGIDIFQADGNTVHKAILFIALAAAVLAIFIVQRWAQIAFGLTGLAAIAIEYLAILDDPERTIQLREGAFLAALGFLLVLVAGLLPSRLHGGKKPVK
ncbi:MAG: hypothetical protein WD740_03060 [Anaerolineales bacterium]